ncbi:MAG: error-prone DNA polymerase, partial [Moraxellaceae bacterium]
GDMVHPYLKRRNGQEEVHYANEEIREVLGRTLGVPIFQEQVIKLAMVAAGFSAGEADQLRRAMARWKRNGELKPFQDKLIKGMLERGYELEFAEKICLQIQGFGEYGFPESHAASFALLTYVSAWLKYYEPAAFCCALLNSQPMGFYSSSQLIQDVRRHGITVHPVDVCDSVWENSLELEPINSLEPCTQSSQPDIQLGLSKIKGLNQHTAERIIHARKRSPFKDLSQLVYQAQLSRSELDCLARAGALNKLAGHRYQARWEAQGVEPSRPLFNDHSNSSFNSSSNPSHTATDDAPAEATQIQLPAPSEAQEVYEDHAHLGLSLRRHPLALLRDQHKILQRCKTAAQLPSIGHKRFVQVAGLVTGRQRPMTASGVIFLTLEDETGNVNVIIWRSVAERQRTPLMSARLLKVKGTVEKEGSVIHVIAGHLQSCDELLGSLAVHSRDFH